MENQNQGWLRVIPDDEYRTYQNNSAWRLTHAPHVWVLSPLGLHVEVDVGSEEYKLCELFKRGPRSAGDCADRYEGDVRPELWAEALFVLGRYKEFQEFLAAYPVCVAHILAPEFLKSKLPVMLFRAQSVARVIAARSAAQAALGDLQ